MQTIVKKTIVKKTVCPNPSRPDSTRPRSGAARDVRSRNAASRISAFRPADTRQEDEALASRLKALMRKRYGSLEFRGALADYERVADETEKSGEAYDQAGLMLLIASAAPVIRHGASWAEMKDALENPGATDAGRALLNRMGRAARLLRRLVEAGVRARRDRLQSAMLARLNHLLGMDRRHHAETYRNWQFSMDDGGQKIYVRLASRMMVASFSPILERMTIEEIESLESVRQSESFRAGREKGLLGEYLDGHGRHARQARRNERLLNRLLIKGVFRRGEMAYAEFRPDDLCPPDLLPAQLLPTRPRRMALPEPPGPDITLDEALRRHNARHPESPLVDVTDQFNGAMTLTGFGAQLLPFFAPEDVVVIHPGREPREGDRVVLRRCGAFRCVLWSGDTTPGPDEETVGIAFGVLQRP